MGLNPVAGTKKNTAMNANPAKNTLPMYIKEAGNFPWLLLFAIIAYCGYFINMGELGFYEDDYALIGPHLLKNWSEIFDYVKSCFAGFPQGRPLHFVVPTLLTAASKSLTGGIIGLYIFGIFICAMNSWLLFVILRQTVSLPAALLGGLVLMLTPADAPKMFLHVIPVLFMPVTIGLAAIFLYARGKESACILLSLIVLLWYESVVLIILFAPFFTADYGKDFLKKLFRHIGACCAIMLVVGGLRLFIFAEGRISTVVESGIIPLIKLVIRCVILGPLYSFISMIQGTGKGVRHIIQEAGAMDLVILPLFACLLAYLGYTLFQAKALNDHSNDPIPFWRRPVFWGMVMIPAMYLMAFSRGVLAVNARSGRMASVHTMSAIAWAVFAAGMLDLCIVRCGQKIWPRSRLAWGLGLTSLVLVSWMAYAGTVRNEYARNWDIQRTFFKNLEEVYPNNLHDVNAVLFSPISMECLLKPRSMARGPGWALPIACGLYFGSTSASYSLGSEYVRWKEENGNLYFFNDGIGDWGNWRQVQPENTAYISCENGKPVRIAQITVKLENSEEETILFFNTKTSTYKPLKNIFVNMINSGRTR